VVGDDEAVQSAAGGRDEGLGGSEGICGGGGVGVEVEEEREHFAHCTRILVSFRA